MFTLCMITAADSAVSVLPSNVVIAPACYPLLQHGTGALAYAGNTFQCSFKLYKVINLEGFMQVSCSDGHI